MLSQHAQGIGHGAGVPVVHRLPAWPDVRSSRVVVLDDEPAGARLLSRMLEQDGYVDVGVFTDPTTALQDVFVQPPALLLLDMRMSVPGLQVLHVLADRGLEVPVICLTADSDRSLRRSALELGVADFLTKPFEVAEVLLRVRNTLRVGALQAELRQSNRVLEERVEARTRELLLARDEVLRRLSLAAEFRDDSTHEHTLRVGSFAAAIATELGHDPDWVEQLRQVAPLHDLGKIGVPDAVLLKPAGLTAAEFDVVKQHTRIGGQILQGGQSALMVLAEQIARTHHERWDGEGYLGLAGHHIPLAGRIVAVADVWDALTHTRPYKSAWPADRARAEIARTRGSHFDPDVADAFLTVLDEGRL